jgi:hypothetical protein
LVVGKANQKENEMKKKKKKKERKRYNFPTQPKNNFAIFCQIVPHIPHLPSKDSFLF